jgi:transposase
MQHNSTSWTAQHAGNATTLTVGLDLGDAYSSLCVLDQEGEIVEEGRVRTTSSALQRRFQGLTPSRVVLEVGTHSPWVSRLVAALGHEVIVANARAVRLIAESDRKRDRTDAERLARLGRLDPCLLAPIRHRGQKAQEDLAFIRSRASLVRARTALINHVRGAAKSYGGRLPACSAPAFPRKVVTSLPEGLRPALLPHFENIGQLTRQIAEADRQVEALCELYPETRLLRQVPGVGPLTALSYVLTLEDPSRFRRSRDVGPYLGLTPRQRQSGTCSPQLPISKAGDSYLRQLLVGCAHYILGPFGPDSDLRRWGLRYAPPGARNAKHRAVVAVARRLAVLLHRLWVTGEVYQPLGQEQQAA